MACLCPPAILTSAGDGLWLLPTEVQAFGEILLCSWSDLVPTLPAGSCQKGSPQVMLKFKRLKAKYHDPRIEFEQNGFSRLLTWKEDMAYPPGRGNLCQGQQE